MSVLPMQLQVGDRYSDEALRVGSREPPGVLPRRQVSARADAGARSAGE
jgi:hypothetical protein